MTTLIAIANIQQLYPAQSVPEAFLGRNLEHSTNLRVQQRRACQKLAYFLLTELCKTAQIDTALLAQVKRTESGRPQFPLAEIDFNISHSDDWVAVMLAKSEQNSAVGIDIEFVKKARNYTALLQHFAAPNELDWFAEQPNQEQAFYRIWCLREAILKSQGVGIVKLSEVCHEPVHKRLGSNYCPRGELLFSAELPCYLAAFSAADSASDFQFFRLENQQLTPILLQSAVNYSVNFTE